MTTTVQSTTLSDGPRNVVVNRQGVQTDATGETAATFIDLSTLSNINNRIAPDSLSVKKIEYSISGGFGNVQLFFDADANDELAKLAGDNSGVLEFDPPFTDPKSTGYSGDILITTSDGAAADNATYDITIHAVKKQ